MRSGGAALLGACIAAVACTAGPVQSPTLDPALPGYVAPGEAASLIATCPVSGIVATYFRLPPPTTFRDVFPNALQTPELEGVSGLFVVTYDGVVRLGPQGGGPGGGPTPEPRNVVCVITQSGPNVYLGVSFDGVQLPPGAHLGGPG